MAIQHNCTISSELAQFLEGLQGRAVTYATQALAEGEADARLLEIFPPPLPYVPEWKECAEDGCTTLTQSAICDPCHDEFLTTLSPKGRAVFGLPPLSPFEVDTTGRPPFIAGTQYAYDADGNWNPDAGPPTLTRADLRRKVELPHDLGQPPALLARRDGQVIVYAGKVNWLFGKPGSGKSFILLSIIEEAILRGGRVALSDHEDRPGTLAERAHDMDKLVYVQDEEGFEYYDHELWTADAAGARQDVAKWLLEAVAPEYSLLIIDAAESAGCPSDGSAVTEWMHQHVREWNLLGLGVVIVDHTTKRKVMGDDVLGPIGSQHKLAAVTGAALEVTGTPWTRKRNGQVTLKVHKDRVGYLPPRGKPVATVVGEHVQQGDQPVLVLKYTAPTAAEEQGGDSTVDERILAAIVEAGPEGITGTRNLYALAGIRAKLGNDTLKRVEAAGWVWRDTGNKAHIFVATAEGRAHLLGLEVEGQADDDGEAF